MRRSFTLIFVASSLGLGAAFGCQDNQAALADAATDAQTTDAQTADVADVGPPDSGPGKEAKLGAANFMVSVIDQPAWPESKLGPKRLGYLRAGAVVMAYDKPIPNDDCKEGWFQLVSGGFVCGKAVTFELTSSRVKLAPRGPDIHAGMPYRYGVNLTDDTPLYRRVLSNEDRKKFEPWLVPKPAPSETPDEPEPKGEPAAAAGGAAAGAGAGGGASGGAGGAGGAAGTGGAVASGEAHGEAEEDPEQPKKREIVDAGVKDAGPRRLKGLKGHGVVVRKMVRGFYLALDREFKAAGARWWRTTFGFAVPFDRIMVQPGVTKHHGAWFAPAALSASGGDAGVFASGLPRVDAGGYGAFFASMDAGTFVASGLDASMLGSMGHAGDLGDGGELGNMALASAVEAGFVTNGYSARIDLRWDEKEGKPKVVGSAELPRRSAVGLTGARTTVSGMTYAETVAGFWVRPGDLTMAHPQVPPDLAPNEKWIDVDITRQALVAYEGLTPVFATLISTGRRNPQDKEHDFPTPQGTFHVREKHVTTTMDGDVASDGPYSIEDVPWVMYFEGSYALHGAFWHDQFGHMRSHGCVNMSPDDARTLFAWSEPHLPDGWHGVMATEQHAGTRIVIHEDPVAKK